MPGSASAASFVVNSLSDGSPNGCTTDPQGCTLEEAITDANGNGSAVTDQVTFSVTGTILLGSALPTITTPTTITGPSPAELRVAGNVSANGIFGVNVSLGQSVRIERLKIESARAFGFTGGGISMSGSGALVLDNVWFFDNSATSGGAIGYSAGTTTVTNSLFSNNRADPATGEGFGGAILGSGPGHLNLINSTLTNNSAREFAGAIHTGTGATLTVNSSTITGNTANTDNDAIGNGGGVVRNASAGATTIANTILAGNSVGAGGGTDLQCSGTFTSQGYNLRSAADSGCAGFTATGDFLNSNPLLGTLGPNGGLTQTIPLLTGSPATNAGNPVAVGGAFPACPATDQRGLPRGGEGGVCDVGAFEAQMNPTTTAVSCNPASLTFGAGSTTCTVTVADTGGLPTNPSGNVSFTSNGAGTFSGGSSCLLLGNAGSPGCQVTYTPTTAGSGPHQITASYPGDLDHLGSQGTTQVAVRRPGLGGAGPSPAVSKAIKKCKKKLPKGPKRRKCIKRAKKRAQA